MIVEMKPVTMFITDWCPYCKQAIPWIDELKKENPKYADIDVNIIDEELQPEISKTYDYYYVPTFYVDKVKINEDAASKDIVRQVLDRAIE